MRKIIVVLITAALCGCNYDAGINVSTETATDTITNVTNPGVGSASDDTTIKD